MSKTRTKAVSAFYNAAFYARLGAMLQSHFSHRQEALHARLLRLGMSRSEIAGLLQDATADAMEDAKILKKVKP